MKVIVYSAIAISIFAVLTTVVTIGIAFQNMNALCEYVMDEMGDFKVITFLSQSL